MIRFFSAFCSTLRECSRRRSFGGPEFLIGAREFGLPGSGSTDLVAVAADGSILVAECKLAKNDEIKREVIGQILEYGAYLWRMSYEKFEDRFRLALKRCLPDVYTEEVPSLADLVRAAIAPATTRPHPISLDT
jgi:hypothetical protein